jgi:hypothetical protein
VGLLTVPSLAHAVCGLLLGRDVLLCLAAAHSPTPRPAHAAARTAASRATQRAGRRP